MQSLNEGNGTHWVVFKYKNNEIDYFDSFGFPPPVDIMKKSKGKYYIHIKKYKIMIQHLVDGFV